jgi:tetratricopeptide (TPR) repeat protein
MTPSIRSLLCRASVAALILAAIGVGACAPSHDTRGGADLSAVVDTMPPQRQLSYLEGLEAEGRSDAPLYFHIGNAFYALEQLDSAVVYYGRALEVDSTDSKAWVNMGLAYDGQHQPDAARRSFEEALKVNPTDVLALCHLGFSYFSRGQVEKAIGYYQRALSIDPNSAQAHYNLGLAFADSKVFPEALREWQRVVELDPGGELGKTAAENVKLIKTYMELDDNR